MLGPSPLTLSPLLPGFAAISTYLFVVSAPLKASSSAEGQNLFASLTLGFTLHMEHGRGLGSIG
jgi:hypothetical protein